MTVDLLLQNAKAIAGHDDLMKEGVDGDLLWFYGLIARLKDHRATPPFVAEGNVLGQPAPKPQNFQQRPFRFRVGLDLGCHVLGDDLIELAVGLIDLFDAVMDKGDLVDGVFHAHDNTGAILRMLQTGTDAKRCLIHIDGELVCG